MKCSPKTMLKIGVVLALVLAGAAVAFPQSRSLLWVLAPFLLFALCPLSMLVMMVGMGRGHHGAEKLFVCPECGFAYREAGWAKKCAAWCKEHQSCNLEITAHAVLHEKDVVK